MSDLMRKSIKETFLRLLNERPYAKITIKDVTDACGICRNSFYYHFADLPALTEEILFEEVERLVALYPEVDSAENCLCIAVEFAAHNRKAVYHIYNSVNRDIFERYLWKLGDYVAQKYLQTLCADYAVSDADRKIILRYYTCMIFGQVTAWLYEGMREDILPSVHRLCELKKGAGEELCRRASEGRRNP